MDALTREGVEGVRALHEDQWRQQRRKSHGGGNVSDDLGILESMVMWEAVDPIGAEEQEKLLLKRGGDGGNRGSAGLGVREREKREKKRERGFTRRIVGKLRG